MTAAMLECRKKKLEHEKRLADKRQQQLDKINTVYLATLLLEKNKVCIFIVCYIRLSYLLYYVTIFLFHSIFS